MHVQRRDNQLRASFSFQRRKRGHVCMAILIQDRLRTGNALRASRAHLSDNRLWWQAQAGPLVNALSAVTGCEWNRVLKWDWTLSATCRTCRCRLPSDAEWSCESCTVVLFVKLCLPMKAIVRRCFKAVLHIFGHHRRLQLFIIVILCVALFALVAQQSFTGVIRLRLSRESSAAVLRAETSAPIESAAYKRRLFVRLPGAQRSNELYFL